MSSWSHGQGVHQQVSVEPDLARAHQVVQQQGIIEPARMTFANLPIHTTRTNQNQPAAHAGQPAQFARLAGPVGGQVYATQAAQAPTYATQAAQAPTYAAQAAQAPIYANQAVQAPTQHYYRHG